MATLRAQQLAALSQLLSLNAPEKADALPAWKVLVLDKPAQDVVATALRVQDLRDHGVTVHAHVNSHRTALPVPALYFCAPTRSNLQRVAQDLQERTYASTYVSLTSPLPRAVLDDFAHEIVSRGLGADAIEQVYDQYLDFLVLADSLFDISPSLATPVVRDIDAVSSVYERLNDPKATESDVDELTDRTARGLFSVIVTMYANDGNVPVIRAPRGNAAEMVARKVDKKLRDWLATSPSSRSSAASADSQLGRPLLAILDRNVDLVPMLSHSWTYHALVNDVLGMRLNRVEVEAPEHGRLTKRTYDLDAKDFFWHANAPSPFPQVAEEIDKELNRYKQDAAEITRSTGVSDVNDLAQM